MSKLIVAFTGHRPDKLGGYGSESALRRAIKKTFKDLLLGLKPDGCISGMALGVDQWAAEVCTELKIPWIAAIPCPSQDLKWSSGQKKHYQTLLQNAKSIVQVSDRYSGLSMQRRNEWMVDRCHKLIAVWDGSKGGTFNCLKYAKKTLGNDNIIYIMPQEQERYVL